MARDEDTDGPDARETTEAMAETPPEEPEDDTIEIALDEGDAEPDARVAGVESGDLDGAASPEGVLEGDAGGDPAATAETNGATDATVPSEGEAPDDETEDPQHTAKDLVATHRFGLRLGTHRAGNLLRKLKARLGKEDESEAEQQQHEVEEAISERIEPDERYKEVETYPIHPPYAYVRMLFDDERKEYIYQVLEPLLTKTEKEILDFIEDTIVDNLTVSPAELEDVDELEFITDQFNDVIFDYSIILHEDEKEEEAIKKKLLYYLRRDFIGHGPIDVVMEDPYIEDISCDGPHVPVFLYHRKYESMKSTVCFEEHTILDAFVIKMAQRAGKHISIAEPILDATMTDGSRLQSTLGTEVSAGGSTFTIRKFRPDPFTPPDLVMFRTMSAEMLAYLWIAVQNGASIMYAGGTASGKTTSLNAILLFIPPNMKIVSIEDTREVNLPHENWIAGITRHGFGPRDQFGRQAGEIDMFQLLKNALRQRPEYIIVGEVRGQEAYSLFQAMATGHAAYGTMHADSVDAVIHRLESDPINIPRSLLEALDIVSVQIQTRVGGKRVRRTKQISEIVGLDPHTREILTNEVFRWVPKDDSFRFSGVSYILERIQLEKGMPSGSMVKELKRRAEIIEWMIRMHIQDYQDVSRTITAYYKEPELVLSLVRGEITPEEAPMGLRQLAAHGGAKSDSPLSASALAAAPGTESTGEGDATAVSAARHPAEPSAALEASGEDGPLDDVGETPGSAEDAEVTDEAVVEGQGTGAAAPTTDGPGPDATETAPVGPSPPERPEGWGETDGAQPTEKAHDWGGTEAFLHAAEDVERTSAGSEEDDPLHTEDRTTAGPAEAPEPPEGSASEDADPPPDQEASKTSRNEPGSTRQLSPEESEEWLRKVEEKIRARYEQIEKEKKDVDEAEQEAGGKKGGD